MTNKYDNYPFPELQRLVDKMQEDLSKMQKEFAKFQQQEQSEVTHLELAKSKISPSDPEFAVANKAWLDRRTQSGMAVRQMQGNLRQLETELRYAQESLDRKTKAKEEAEQAQQ
ncbi:hypothetical protein ACFL0Z_00180 [Patescibacteria group bacterium]